MYDNNMKFFGFFIFIFVNFISFPAYADEISAAKELLANSAFSCSPYIYFQKPAEFYKYFTLSVCIENNQKSITYLLTNNCADTIYWTGIGPRIYNGNIFSNSKYNVTDPYVLGITFHFDGGPVRVKIGPGETATVPFVQFESIRVPNDWKSSPIKSYLLTKPYVIITMAFEGDPINFNEVFVETLVVK